MIRFRPVSGATCRPLGGRSGDDYDVLADRVLLTGLCVRLSRRSVTTTTVDRPTAARRRARPPWLHSLRAGDANDGSWESASRSQRKLRAAYAIRRSTTRANPSSRRGPRTASSIYNRGQTIRPGNSYHPSPICEPRETIMKIDGRCHCGYVTFEVEANPERMTICNCTDC